METGSCNELQITLTYQGHCVSIFYSDFPSATDLQGHDALVCPEVKMVEFITGRVNYESGSKPLLDCSSTDKQILINS